MNVIVDMKNTFNTLLLAFEYDIFVKLHMTFVTKGQSKKNLFVSLITYKGKVTCNQPSQYPSYVGAT